MSDTTPLAPVALNAVAHALQIEQSRGVRTSPSGFTWWIAPGLRQHVRFEEGAPDRAPWLRIETPIWRGADPHAIAPLVDALSHHARGAAVRHAGDGSTVSLVTRAPLPVDRIEERAAALAGTGAIQAYLVAWAWGEARTRLGDRAAAWRDALPHPELGMDVPPDPVLLYRDRVLRPQAEAREGAFASALLSETTDAIERTGVGILAHRRADGRSVAFGVDLGFTIGILEVGLIQGPVDAHSLGVGLTLHGHHTEPRAMACCRALLERQLAPGADAWTLGSWMPMARRDGRPGFGVTHGFFLPLAIAETGMGAEVADAAGRSVDGLRAWLDEGAPATESFAIAAPPTAGRLVA